MSGNNINNKSSRGRRASTVQDVRELAAHLPGKAPETLKCSAPSDAQSVLEQAALSTSSSSGLATLSRSAFTLSSPSNLEEDTRQTSPQSGNAQLLDGFLPTPGKCASVLSDGGGLAGGLSAATAGPVTFRPQRLDRLYLRPLASAAPASIALASGYGNVSVGAARGTSTVPLAPASVAAACTAAGAGGTHGGVLPSHSSSGSRNGGGGKSSSGGDSNGGTSSSASSSTSSVRGGGHGGNGSSGRRRRLAAINLRVTSSPTVLQQHGSSTKVIGANPSGGIGVAAPMPGDVAQEAGDDLLSDEGEQSATLGTELATNSPQGADQQPPPMVVSLPTTAAAASIVAGTTATSMAVALPAVSIAGTVSTPPTKQPMVELVSRPPSSRDVRPLEAAVKQRSSCSGGILPTYVDCNTSPPPATSFIHNQPAVPAAPSTLAERMLYRPPYGAPSTMASQLLYDAPVSADPGMPLPHHSPEPTPASPLLPVEVPAASRRDDGAIVLEEPAAATSSNKTCRIHMKLHSSNPEQLQPSMLAPLAQLMLPYGWMLRGLAARSGCLELVLDYEHLDGAMTSGSRDAQESSNTTATATTAPVTDSHIARLMSCLHQQGLVDPSLEPTVVVQVDQRMWQVQWQGHGGSMGAIAGVGAGVQVGPMLQGASADMRSDAAAPDTPIASSAIDMAAAMVREQQLAPPPVAGSWHCQQAAHAHTPAPVLGLQPVVVPQCMVAPMGSAAAMLCIAVPGTGLHSPTVRCLGGYLEVQLLHHLSVSAIHQAAATTAAAMATPLALMDSLGTHPGFDWMGATSAAAAVAAAGPDGEVFIIQVSRLPNHCAMLQVELRAGSSAESWSSHVSVGHGPDLQSPGMGEGQGAVPSRRSMEQQQQQPKGASQYLQVIPSTPGPQQHPVPCQVPELMSAAAPVLLLRTGTPADCTHGHGAPAVVEAGVCSPHEAACAAEELSQLKVCILQQSSMGVEQTGHPAALVMASQAAREFMDDLGLLLDAAACVGGERAQELATASSPNCPSYSQEIRQWLLQQLGLDSTDSIGGVATATVTLLRQHLADTAVTLLAACVELSLPYTARLIVDSATHWLQLCTMDMLLAAAAAGEGVAPTATGRVQLEALLQVTAGMVPAAPLSRPAGRDSHSGAGGASFYVGEDVGNSITAAVDLAANATGSLEGNGGRPGAAASSVSRPAPRLNLSAGALGGPLHHRSSQAAGGCVFQAPALAGLSVVPVPGPVSGPELSGGNWLASLGPASGAAPVILSQPGFLELLRPQLSVPDASMVVQHTTSTAAPPFSTCPPPPTMQQPACRYKRFYTSFEGTAAAAGSTPTSVPANTPGPLAARTATSERRPPGDLWQEVSPELAAVAGLLPSPFPNTHLPPPGLDTGFPQQSTPQQGAVVPVAETPMAVLATASAVMATSQAACRQGPATAVAAAAGTSSAVALLQDFGRQVLASLTGFATPNLEQAFWLETTARLQTMCRLYAGFTLGFVSLSVVRAFFEDGAAAAAFMALYQGGQALLLAAFGLMGAGRPERLFGTAVVSTVLRAVCHTLLSRGLAPLPSFVLPMCRMWVDMFNEGVAKAVFEQVPLFLFLTLMLFLELPTAYALYVFLDTGGGYRGSSAGPGIAGQLCGCLLLRLACFGSIRTAVVVGTQAAWRMRFLARRHHDGQLHHAKLD